MASVDAPKFDDLMIPVLDILRASEEPASNDSIVEGLKAKGFPTGGVQPGSKNRTHLEYRAAWARTYLKNFGALENPKRGMWRITEKGKTVSQDDVKGIVNSVVAQARANKDSKKKKSTKQKIQPQRSSTRAIEPVDQARVILELLERGILTQAAANKALSKVVGA